eukprot:TRINITY_DN13967_c0_g1_i10.p2 TRINITY_DN13967_c0_g1~~TRINITY_DN13967_c0_g1_i10.p2  ORF type:complete len:101 (+),score=7.02 TRINITY_DN13967_c0_g1_i10:796-1098(+)
MNYQLCHHAFCLDCIDKNFRGRVKLERLGVKERNWPCFTCRGQCKCSRCKQNLANELSLLNSAKTPNCRLPTEGTSTHSAIEAANDVAPRAAKYKHRGRL